MALTNGSAASGGGILNSGFLTLDSVRIAGNEATGPFADGGGGILNFKSLVLSNSVVAGNRSANSGGGIRNINGTVAVVASEVSDNVGGTGGGIANHSGALSVNSSTIARNFTYDGGGGIINYFGRTDVLNSTISGNNVQSAKGGGGLLASYGEVSIQFSTIASNLAVNGGNGGGLRKEVSATMTVGNSIVAFNRASTGGDYYGTVTFTDRNVFTGDFGLGPLADNGGPTPTHLPASNSPAVDAGNPSGAPAVDQRGVSRPQGAVPDIGSVETSVAVAAPELRLSMRREGQELVFTFPAAQGASYTVEYVDALHPDASWSVLLQGLHATNGVAEFREPLDVQQPQRYYRARLN